MQKLPTINLASPGISKKTIIALSANVAGIIRSLVNQFLPRLNCNGGPGLNIKSDELIKLSVKPKEILRSD